MSVNTPPLASRTAHVRPSPTLAITAKAAAMQAAGKDVIRFGAGEPDFNTPEAICEAGIDAIRAGFTKYTASAGIPELRKAIAEKLAHENGLSGIAPENVVVTCGAKHGIYNALMVAIEPGDEVLIPAPFWMTYTDQTRLAGGVPVVVQSTPEAGFVPTREQLEAARTPKTKAIMINTPNNPTGVVWPRETIEMVADFALKHGLWIIADEIYEKLIYQREHVGPTMLGPEVAAQTLLVGGCSKSYAMTGWRIGYVAGPLAAMKAMSNFQDQVTSNPTSFAQMGALYALRMDDSVVEGMRQEFAARRELMFALLRAIPGLKVPEAQGAFYALPDVTAFLGGKVKTDIELADLLLDEALVATVPGTVFTAAGHIRFSYTADQDNIRRGIARVAEALAALAP